MGPAVVRRHREQARRQIRTVGQIKLAARSVRKAVKHLIVHAVALAGFRGNAEDGEARLRRGMRGCNFLRVRPFREACLVLSLREKRQSLEKCCVGAVALHRIRTLLIGCVAGQHKGVALALYGYAEVPHHRHRDVGVGTALEGLRHTDPALAVRKGQRDQKPRDKLA